MVVSRVVASPRVPGVLVHVHVSGGEGEDHGDLITEILVLELEFITEFGEGPEEEGNSAICDSSHDEYINK